MKFIKRPYRGFFVDIGSVVGESDKIWTVALNESSDKTPLVMLHGLGKSSKLTAVRQIILYCMEKYFQGLEQDYG